jgi:predicted transcriptional regulator
MLKMRSKRVTANSLENLMFVPPKFVLNMPRRGKVEIYIEVLEIVMKGEAKPTRIMYSANLSWKVFQNVLTNLITQGLINENEEPAGKERDVKRYEITESGMNVLKYFRKATTALPK